MDLPVLATSRTFHVGTMQLAEKGVRATRSLEGHCLSVSHCPAAWAAIARLGGQPLWQLDKPNALFLDMRKVVRSRKLRKLIEVWGADNGLAETKMLWCAWQYDSEEEAWQFTLHGSEDEALAEATEEEGPRGQPAVELVDVVVGTEELSRQVGHPRLGQEDAFDYLAIVWAEATQPQLDGVWWRERYAPASLSAPRGGVFPGKVASWAARSLPLEEIRDDLRRALRAGKVVMSGW